MTKKKKSLPRFAAALCAVFTAMALAGCSSATSSDDNENSELSLKALDITFDWGGDSLITYQPSRMRYAVTSVSGNNNFVVIPTPNKASDTLKMTRSNGEDIPLTDGGFTLPVLGIKDAAYNATLSVSREGKTTIEYVIMVNPPVPPAGKLEEVESVFKDAENTVKELTKTSTIVLGDPSKNSSKAKDLSDLLSQLNRLKQGESMERTYMAIDSEGNVTEQKEQIIVYDTDKINDTVNRLNALAKDFTADDTYIRVSEQMFNFKGEQETVLLDPVNGGVYEIEAVGGSGGTMTNTSKRNSALGGKGGHVTARFSFPANQPNLGLTVRVGGQGEGNAVYDAAANDGAGSYLLIEKDYTKYREGGWPNGGNGGGGSRGAPNISTDVMDFIENVTYSPGTGGGGGTDVILGKLTSDFVYATDNSSRILVAGGGGGNTQKAGTGWPILVGGNAGQNGKNKANSSHPQAGGALTTDVGVTGRNATGDGSDGEGNGGGGGGYLGGGALGAANSSPTTQASGAGGTNFVSPTNLVTDSSTIVTAETSGNGWAKITWVSAPQ